MASEKRKASWRKYGAKRRKDPAYRAKQRAWWTEWRAQHKDDPELRAKAAARQKLYRDDPELRPKHLARWKIRRKVASGKVKKQPCEVCGASKAEAHHDDYSRPLDVRWLCIQHHREHHAKATNPQRGDAG